MGRFFSHERSERSDEWFTPADVLIYLGDFDTDPCAGIVRPWDIARINYTIAEDGLSREWTGRVFMNPPYGNKTEKWLEKLSSRGNGIALIFARTETRMFHAYIWNKADAIFFLKGRLYFLNEYGESSRINAGAPSCLVAYGRHNVEVLESLPQKGLEGKFIKINC